MAKLSDLKKLVDDARAKAPAPARSGQSAARDARHRRALGASKHRDGDIDLAQAFADVRKLPPTRRARVGAAAPRAHSPAAHCRRRRRAGSVEVRRRAGAASTWEIGQEHEAEQTFVRRGIGIDVLAKLRRGHWSVQGDLDLHGHSTDEAHDALADFLDEARQRGFRCVRVVHGKGLTSPNKEPVLKGKVRRWLSHWDDVLAYCEAPRHAGGGGAVLVLLRGG